MAIPEAQIQEWVQEWLRLDKVRTSLTWAPACLRFGTAGLRAQMAAGFARLNSLTIIQTSQGLAEYLLAKIPNTPTAGIVVGYDARHNSRKFAQLAAAVFESKGIIVWWYEDIVHTPLVPYAVKVKKAAAGVMVTASHNPAQDNGYKVYNSNGCQINSPDDDSIACSITQNLEPTVWETQGGPLQKPILDPMKASYYSSIVSQLKLAETNKLPVQFMYTPMHGVGLRYMTAAVEVTTSKGIKGMIVVDQQAQPDPEFSTVKYPNPEEAGALDLAMSTADKANVSLILANDPDADRFAVAEKVDGVWHQFTGDQVGALLAYWILSSFPSPATCDDVMLTTAVSSQMLSFIAKAEGFSVYETLTGFKWLGKTAQDLQGKGKRVHFAYEEALGYMFPDVVYDKDGIAAAAVFLRACSSWSSPWAKLQELYGRYGYFVTTNTYWRSPSGRKTEAVLQRVRNLEDPFPRRLCHRKVVRWRNITTGYDSATGNNIADLPKDPSSRMITCWLEGSKSDDGVRFTVRTSGTEPKIKVYLECRSKDHESAERGALEVLGWIRQQWFNDPELTMDEKFANV
ncbi:MAG: hypothetical protein Q9225_005608 [Loekoesia sp. 1 TL-2023]